MPGRRLVQETGTGSFLSLRTGRKGRPANRLQGPMDKAGKKFWNDLWSDNDIPKAIDPSDPGIRNWGNRRFHQVFLRWFDKSQAPSMTLLEVGCGKSAWLPY